MTKNRFLEALRSSRLVVPVSRGTQQLLRWQGGRLERHGYCSVVPLRKQGMLPPEVC